MKKYYVLLLLSAGCATKSVPKLPKFIVKNCANESMSCRALLIDETKVWLAMDKGRYGFYDSIKDSLVLKSFSNSAPTTEFRSCAATKESIFVLSVGNPALLYKINKQSGMATLVYKEENENVFYDSMQFINEQVGFAMGDPVENCLSLIKTTNGGSSWEKIPCKILPTVVAGEAAFATSNTNLIVKEGSLFMVSGGKLSRVFVSNDLGSSWQVYDTPIVQGEEMTGIFTADFYDTQIGIVAGGNYLKQTQNWDNKAITTNGGKSWRLIGQNTAFGHASCVQFVPKSNGKKIISVGGTGMYYSSDFGKNWFKFSDDNDFYTFRFQSDRVFYAAGNHKLVRFEMH